MTGSTNACGKTLRVVPYTKDNLTATKNTYTQFEIDLTADGYGGAVGIAGFEFANATESGYGCSFCSAYSMYTDGSAAYVNVRNHNANTNAKIAITLYLMYFD